MSDTSPLSIAVARHLDKEGITAYTVTQAAAMVEKSPDTLRRWRNDGSVVPSETMRLGHTTIYLYTPTDMVALRRKCNSSYPGQRTDLEE